ncbi:hypothetical protein HK101_001239 [Irineochytrium annulatum]|nr:hypothetical protein HK101_001239 [Irineochytrium annulatum]
MTARSDQRVLKIGWIHFQPKALEADIRMLVDKFLDRRSLKFEVFADVWKSLNFSLIQSATSGAADEAKQKFVDNLFGVVIGIMVDFGQENGVGVAVLYALYLLYFTQHPNNVAPIKITPDSFNALSEIVADAKAKVPDAAMVFNRLVFHNAFLIVAAASTFSARGYSLRPKLAQLEEMKAEVINYMPEANRDLNKMIDEYSLVLPEVNFAPLPRLEQVTPSNRSTLYSSKVA